MKKLLITFNLIFFSLLLFSSCSNEEESNREATVAVKKIMALRKQAIETKDIELYKSLILPDYNDGKSTYKEQIEFMASAFQRHEKIEFSYQKSPVDIKMNSARMVGKVSYKTAELQAPVWDHEITLFRRIEDKWYISGGITLGLF